MTFVADTAMPTRPLTPADLPALRALAALAEGEGFLFVTRFLDELLARRVRLDAPDEFFVGALIDGQLAAIGGVTPDPYVGDPRTGRLRHLYVRPDHRGEGIGRALVAELERRAEACYACLRLRTDTSAAAAFYERLGYHPVTSSSATHQRMLPALSTHRDPDGRC